MNEQFVLFRLRHFLNYCLLLLVCAGGIGNLSSFCLEVNILSPLILVLLCIHSDTIEK